MYDVKNIIGFSGPECVVVTFCVISPGKTTFWKRIYLYIATRHVSLPRKSNFGCILLWTLRWPHRDSGPMSLGANRYEFRVPRIFLEIRLPSTGVSRERGNSVSIFVYTHTYIFTKRRHRNSVITFLSVENNTCMPRSIFGLFFTTFRTNFVFWIFKE